MKRWIVLLVIAVLIGGLCVIAEDAKPDQAKIEALIQQLGDDDWPTREKAQEQLEAIGLPAEPFLKKAVQKDSDPEVKTRVGRILDHIGLLKSPNLIFAKDKGIAAMKWSDYSIKTILPVANLPTDFLQFSAAPNGGKLAFISYPKGVNDQPVISVINLNDGKNKEIELKPNMHRIDRLNWSPDSQKIVCVGEEEQWLVSNIWMIDLSGEPKKLTDSKGGNEKTYYCSSPIWSTDGKKIAFIKQSNDLSLVIMDADGNHQEKIFTASDNYLRNIAFSPDGKTILFSEYGEIYTVTTDGKKETKLISKQKDYVDKLLWSPDGRKIAFFTHDETLKIIDADGQNPVQLANFNHSMCLWINWSGDSKTIAVEVLPVSKHSTMGVIYVIDTNTKILKKITETRLYPATAK